MAGQVTINNSISIANGSLSYRSNPTAFVDTVDGAKGPTPGAVSVSTEGVDIDLSQLSVPGRVWMQNLDAINTVMWGVRDSVTNVFYPVGDLKPGLYDHFKFSTEFGLEESPGTGSHAGTGTVKFHMRARGGTCNVRVDAFEA
jgi:hypothetical protein